MTFKMKMAFLLGHLHNNPTLNPYNRLIFSCLIIYNGQAIKFIDVLMTLNNRFLINNY